MGSIAPYESQALEAGPGRRMVPATDATPARYFSSRVFTAAITALGYYCGMRVGFALTPQNSPISTLWPPNAILLGLLLLIPVRNWWVSVLVVLPVHLLIQLRAGVLITTSMGWFFGNVAEALLGAVLVRRFTNPDKMFESVRGTLIFLAFAVVTAPLATSFIDAATVILTGRSHDYWLIWTERLFSNCLAELVFVPIVVAAANKSLSAIKAAKPARYWEGLALAAGLIGTSFLAFSFSHPQFHGSPALIYVPLTLLTWAAFRFGALGLGGSLLTIAVIAIEGATHGTGPFTFGFNKVDVLSLQILLCTAATPLTLLTALITERRQVGLAITNLSGRLIVAQEEERSRIAREIHDDYQQRLAVVAANLEMLSRDSGDAETQAHIQQLCKDVSELALDMHSLSHQLHSSTLENLGLEVGIRAFCHEFEQHQGIHVAFTSAQLPPKVAFDSALCLFRVAQEALRNVKRHSGADHAEVRLEWSGHKLHLVVSDSGKGFDSRSHSALSGIGIRSMEERLRLAGGQLQVRSQPSQGTRVEAWLPLASQPVVSRPALNRAASG